MIFVSVSASCCMCIAKNRGGDKARFLLTYCLSAVHYSTQKPCSSTQDCTLSLHGLFSFSNDSLCGNTSIMAYYNQIHTTMSLYESDYHLVDSRNTGVSLS